MFLEISQNSQENTCARVSFLIKLQASGPSVFCEFCEISKNALVYRTPPVSGSILSSICYKLSLNYICFFEFLDMHSHFSKHQTSKIFSTIAKMMITSKNVQIKKVLCWLNKTEILKLENLTLRSRNSTIIRVIAILYIAQ